MSEVGGVQCLVTKFTILVVRQANGPLVHWFGEISCGKSRY